MKNRCGPGPEHQTFAQPTEGKKKGGCKRKRAAKIEARRWDWPPPPEWNWGHPVGDRIIYKRR
jgi:hypothetical protein